ncbi:MAG: DUF429 domain-containing protein [Hyphomicrobiaceae bacterium]
MTQLVAGVDGCPAGWIAVLHPFNDRSRAELKLFQSFADLLAITPEVSPIAIDIPIGLSSLVAIGGRKADKAARAILGDRQSSIFAMPSRSAVMCSTYQQACETALATSAPPRKVSKQAFHLFPKIREVDALMTPGLQERVFECHPEVAFWALNGETALDLPKKIKSRPSHAGLELRRNLLRSAGYSPELLHNSRFPKKSVGPDDIIDACVNAWSAGRIRAGQARRFPDEPEVDERGLRMEIWG